MRALYQTRAREQWESYFASTTLALVVRYGDLRESPGWEERLAAFASQLGMSAERVADLDVRFV